MSIKFAVLYPAHLNLNGDLANIKVLRRRLDWAGVPSSIQVVASGQPIDSDVDLVIIGHGSVAAWNDIRDDLVARKTELETLLANGVQLLAIATGYEMLFAKTATGQQGIGLLGGDIELVERLSKFEVTEFEGKQLLGYLNSEADLAVIARHGGILGINLHGPVLAKNPELADEILTLLLTKHGLTSAGLGNKKAAYADGLVAEVWKLEKELASE